MFRLSRKVPRFSSKISFNSQQFSFNPLIFLLQVFTCLARSSRAGQHRPQLSRRSSSRSPSALTGQQGGIVLVTKWAISFPCPPTFWLSCFLRDYSGFIQVSFVSNIMAILKFTCPVTFSRTVFLCSWNICPTVSRYRYV
jgi:hypothetical protein